jgi:ERCC4-type nuclease
MIIKIDNRERELIKLCKHYLEISPAYKDIEIVVEPLPIGDIIICENTDEKIIIERKSLNDLSCSIKDGRYEEQSYRLNGLNHHNHNIIYLVEGDVNKLNVFKDRTDKTMLYSAMFSLNYYKGFSVFRSINIEESALIICNMAYKIKKSNKKAFYSNQPIQSIQEILKTPDSASVIDLTENLNEDKIQDNQEISNPENDIEYCSVVKKVKKDNITPENIGEIMLCQIPGISSVTAIAIMKEFKTIQNLIFKMNENELCLKDISYTNSKGDVRKINKTAIQNIVKFLKK